VTGRRPRDSADAVLARLGMSADTAVPPLEALGLWSDGKPTPEVWPVVEALALSSNPDQSLRALARLAERSPEGWAALVAGEDHTGPGAVARAAVVAGASEPLADLVAADPSSLRILSGDLGPWDGDQYFHACLERLREAEDPVLEMALEQRRGLLRIAARDLLGMAETPEIAAELAGLAAGILGAAMQHLAEHLDPDGKARIAIIGMGKLGGRELNYVSDVDVMFVCDGDWGLATKLCERFMRRCAQITPVGRAYEVDANLRPEGRDGPLVRTLDAYRSYYERWAKTWEFQALLKARPVAGDVELGAAFTELVEPFVWPDRLEAEAVEEIQKMKGVVEGSKEVQRAGTRQVKLAPGGIRDIEFAVQLLQLVHARHDPGMRSPNTLEALAALAGAGYVGRSDAEDFRRAYVFLRTVEHRLQLTHLRRTHTIPAVDGDRRRLARTMGFASDGGRTDLERFDAELRAVQGLVRRIHEKLFYRPLLSRFAELTADAVLPLDEGGEEARLAEGAAKERLTALGFSNPDGALRHLDAMARGVTRKAKLFRAVLPALLPVLAAAPDPDGGLSSFRLLADRLHDSPTFLRTLRDTPPVGDVLATALGSSKVVGEWLQRQPEVFGLLSDLDGLERQLTPADYRRVADGLLRRGQGSEQVAEGLRRVKRREVVRTAVRDLALGADVEAVAGELTGLAEACLEAATALALREAGEAAEGLRLAVIGLGKLGGGELAYTSDLDVLVVFEPAASSQVAQRVTERLFKILSAVTPEGQAFLVDPNLRPEGKDGPLARSLESYRAYYERWAETWELQALTQARHVAGDAALGAAFVEMTCEQVYPEEAPAKRLQEVRLMKARVERERSTPRRQIRTAARPKPRWARTAAAGDLPTKAVGAPPLPRSRRARDGGWGTGSTSSSARGA
jgi:[glutamine synthetase] adenylyltransferase / [glutamine synthetase]-adenylyl-L-tyrosine phosphorylase